jgi:hypothetical protein
MSRAFLKEARRAEAGRVGETQRRLTQTAHLRARPSLSLSTLVTPTTSTPVQDNTSLIPLLCSILHQSIWTGTRNDKFTGRLRIHAGPKRRQLARQVGACCVLTNTFPLSSRWTIFGSLFSPGRCSASGVSSSCPATAATTWYSSPRSMTTTTVIGPPGGGELDDDFPRGGRRTPGFAAPPSSPEEEETGQPWPGRRRHLVGCRTRASRRRRHPCG